MTIEGSVFVPHPDKRLFSYDFSMVKEWDGGLQPFMTQNQRRSHAEDC